MKVLVTNDDGFRAPGLIALANAIVAGGHEVTVAAPLSERSGGSASLGRVIDGGLIDWQRFTSLELPGIVQGIAIDAPPALAVKIMLSGAFGDTPDVVISGINRGWNTGGSAIHSGTLGAAITACSLGWRAAAISCARPPRDRLDLAARVATSVVALLGEWPRPVALNVNVPDLALADVKGVRSAPVGAQGLLDVEVERVGEELRFKLVEREPDVSSPCDARAVLDGYIAVSRLNGSYGHSDEHPPLAGEMERRLAAGLG